MAMFPAVAVGRVAPLTRCRYEASLTGRPGPVAHLRIRLGAKRVDGYLTRCQLASFVAGDANGRARIVEKGSRWYVGVFRCTYRYLSGPSDQTIIRTRCTHAGRYASTLWFDGYG
jgi:hypothetical protein